MEWLTATNSQSNGAERAPVALGDLHGDRGDPVLVELGRDEGQGQPGPDDGDVGTLTQQVGHPADVVLVAVGEHDGVDAVQPVPDPGEVGEDQVDAGLVLLGEEHPAVDDEQPAGVLEDGHVAADLAQPAQRDHTQSLGGQRRQGVVAPAP